MDKVETVAKLIFDAMPHHRHRSTDIVAKPRGTFQMTVGDHASGPETMFAWELSAPLAKQIIDVVG